MSFSRQLNKSELIQFGAGFMFYIEKHKLMDIISRLLAEISLQPVPNIRLWLGQNIKRIAHQIYSSSLNSFHQGIPADYYQLPKNFYHRIVLHGRPGSGRHSLAHVLGKLWSLVIIDADTLAYHYINGHRQDAQAHQLQRALEQNCVYARSQSIGNIIQARLLQADALQHGWILLNYPNNSCEARELFEHFAVPPNRLIFLQIDERTARMRILTKPYAPQPQSSITYLDRQMQQFRKSKLALNTYLSRRREVLYVDATSCFEKVKSNILLQLTKTPYVLGFKYGDVDVSEVGVLRN